MKEEKEVDLVSFDYILAELIKNEASKSGDDDEVVEDREEHIEEFLLETLRKKVTPTKEQLCLITDLFCTEEKLIKLTIKSRLSLLSSIARLEYNYCQVMSHVPYLDELHDYYEREVDDFASKHILDLKSLSATRLLA